MVKIVAFHSHKGGTGKSIIAVNLASQLAILGYRVIILDMDLAAPTIHTYFPYDNSKKTLTEFFLSDEITVPEVIHDVTYRLPPHTKGKLFVGLSSIDGQLISKIDQRGRTAPLNDLYKLIGLVRNKLTESPWNADYVILDTSPGVSMNSINNVAVAEHLFIIQKLINADLDGTVEMLKIIHQSLRPNTSIIINQLPTKFLQQGASKIKKLIQSRVIDPLNRPNIWFGGIIANDEELIEQEIDFAFETLTSTERKGRGIYSINNEQGIFTQSILKLLDHLLQKSNL